MNRTPPHPRRRTQQRGATLFESLVAFALAALATVGAGRAMQPLRLGGGVRLT